MGIVPGFLNEAVQWERRTGEDDWGNPTFDPPKTIRARVDEETRLSLTAGDREILPYTRVLLGPWDDVKIGDRVDGQEVQGRQTIKLVSGALDGYKVYL